MRKNKIIRFTALMLLCIMILPTFAACGKKNKGPSVEEAVNKYNTVHVKHSEDYYIKFTDETENEIYLPEGVSLDDPDIYKEVKDHWREYILGNTDEKAEQSDEYKEYVKKVSADCKAVYNNYKTSGKNPFGYTAANVGSCEKIQALYEYVYKMALGYGTVGSDYYHDEDLAKAIGTLLEYFYMHYYGENWVKGNKDDLQDMYIWGTSDNWWVSDIGIPLSLMPTLLIMEDYLGSDLVARYLSPFDVENKYPNMTMANRMWIGKGVLASALLQEDGERILKAKNDLMEMFVYVDEDNRVGNPGNHDAWDGFYTDGSFIQHGAIPYAGGYGGNFMSTLVEIMFAFRGTRFEFYEEAFDNQYDYIFDAYVPFTFEGRMYSSVCGRNITRTGFSESTKGLTAYMIAMSVYAPEEAKNNLKSVIKYNLAYVDATDSENFSPALLDYANFIKNDESLEASSGFSGMKVFGCMDRIVQQSAKYSVCIALNSATRIYRYEASTGDNQNGWYISDGAIYIYTDGNNYDAEYFNNASMYKIPGTTASEAYRNSDPSLSNKFNVSPFAGGVTNGVYGVSVYALEYQKGNNVIKTDTKANKSYFLFDNEIVAVGSGISDGTGSVLYTVVDNRLWRENDKLTSSGNELSLNNTYVTTNNLHFTNMGGYVFFEDTDVEYNKNGSYLELWIEHGKNPSRAKYSYVYLPEATVEETTAYAANPDVEILTQTDSIHVVRENKLGITGYAFYLAGTSNGVTASNKCVIMIEESNGEYKVSISDPTQELKNLNITLDTSVYNVSELVSADEGVTFENGTISINFTKNIGQTYTVTLK